jgi:hypothetical protein
MSAVFTHGPLEPTRRYLLIALANYANKSGLAWPSVTELTEKCRLSRREVLYCLGELEREDWFATERCKGKGNRYQLNLFKLKLVQQVHQYQEVLVQEVHPTSATHAPTSATLALANKEYPSLTVNEPLKPEQPSIFSKSKTNGNGSEPDGQMIAAAVMLELRISGSHLPRMITEQATMELHAGRTADQVRDEMILAYQTCQKKFAKKPDFCPSAEKFFGEQWRRYKVAAPVAPKPDLIEQMRQLRQQEKKP